jgi:hypothetical protein
MLCNDVEDKSNDQDESLGQLYDVQIRIKIFYKQSGWAYSFSMTIAPGRYASFKISEQFLFQSNKMIWH